MIKYEYRVTIQLIDGAEIRVFDQSVLGQVIAHQDVETFKIEGDVVTHYIIPYGSISSVVIEKTSTAESNPDDAFCTEE